LGRTVALLLIGRHLLPSTKNNIYNCRYHNDEKKKTEQDEQDRGMKISSYDYENKRQNAGRQRKYLPEPGFRTCYPPLLVSNLSYDSNYANNNKHKEGKRENSTHWVV
jgi:hypothetical protein